MVAVDIARYKDQNLVEQQQHLQHLPFLHYNYDK